MIDAQAETRGVAWVIGAFALCPCHLPVTLSVAGTLLSGTAAGVALRHHPFVAGAVISGLWLAGTAYGFAQLRAAGKARTP